MNRDSKSVLKLARKHGWKVIDIKGSHYILRKEGVNETLCIPHHANKKDLSNVVYHSTMKLIEKYK